MGSYISPKTRAKSCGSSAGSSFVLSLFDDLIQGARSEDAKGYLRSAVAMLQRGETPPWPGTDFSVTDFSLVYQGYNLCRKTRLQLWQEPLTEEAMELAAIAGFQETEARNRYLNENGFIPGWSASCDALGIPRPEQVIHLARLKLASLLGEFCYDEFARGVGFSSGASTRLPRRRGAAPYKFQGKPHVTRNCALLAVNLIWFHEPWRMFCQNRFGRESDPCTWVKVVEGSEYFTVPKTATTLRGAAKEPDLNMFCQRAVGGMIRKRLRQRGIDLNNQETNNLLARKGSEDGRLATLDLSAASDSMSLVLLELLPPSWRKIIEMTRSERISVRGKWQRLEMVSSMGNGFTFELESAFFWALASAASELTVGSSKDVSIYGDDIIVPAKASDCVIAVLGYLGFSTNVEKSFTSGPFRESCGGHYFLGVNVTPFYLRDALSSAPDVYHLVNSFNAWAWSHPGLTWERTLQWIKRHLPRRVCVVPPCQGTRAGVIPPSVSHAPGVHFCLRKQAYVYYGHAELPAKEPADGWHAYLAWLNKPPMMELSIVDSKRVRRFVSRQTTSRWANACVRFALV